MTKDETLLSHMPATSGTLIDKTGLSRSTVYAVLTRMHQAREIYISGYATDTRGRTISKVWAVGRRKDAPPPGRRETNAERMRRVRAAGG